MPSSPNYKRDLKQEQRTAKRRGELGGSNSKNASRKRARRLYEKTKGKCNGDVDHKNGNARDNRVSNLVCKSKSSNRSFARTKSAGKKNKKS